jgi:hypothetical protein
VLPVTDMQTLLRVPDLVAAVEPLVGRTVGLREVFMLIGAGDIKPFGYVLRAPVFTPDQVADVVAAITERPATETCSGGAAQ